MKIHPAAITVAAFLSLLSISSSAQALNVNVKNAPYSAKGDGVTDDRAAIQRALNAVRDAGGGEVYVPNGNYRVTLAPRIFGETALRRVFTIYANVRVRGETRSNAIIKLANGQGNYGAIMAAQTLGDNTSNFELSSITLDQNTTNNPVKSLTDIGTNDGDWSASPIRGAVWLSTGRNIKISNCRFSDIKAVWTIFVASAGTDVENVTVDGNLFDKVGGGSLDFDSSLVYTSTTGALSRIVNNTFTSVNNGQPGSFGLRTAIEIHGKNMLVENNRISGFIIGLNTGGDSPDGTVLNLVRNNLFKNVNTGVVVWGTRSDNGAMTTACNLSILDNVITLNVNGWQNHPQARDAAFSGIRVEQDGSDSDRQISNLDITGNTISFFNFSGTTHINGDRWSNGINYNRSWLSSSQNLTQNLHISHNKITNSPASGIVLYAPVFEGEIANNTVTNPGSSTGASGWRGWQSGVFLQNSQENLTVIGNQFIDNQTTKSLQQGIYAINDVHGYNVESGNSVSGAQAPVFVRGNDAGSGNWTTAPTAPHIDKFYLYYENGASAVSGFDPLRSGSVINLKQLTGTVAVRIVSPAPVGSVKIRIETPKGTTESIKNEEWFYVYLATPSVGSYRITATPFSGSDATGTQGIARNIVFHVINETVR